MYIFIFIGIATFKEMFIKELVGRKTPVTMKISACLCCKSCWGLVCNSDNVIQLIAISSYYCKHCHRHQHDQQRVMCFTTHAEYSLTSSSLKCCRGFPHNKTMRKNPYTTFSSLKGVLMCDEEKLIVKYK